MTAAAYNVTDSQLDAQQIAMLRGLRNGTLLPQLFKLYQEQTPQQLQKLQSAAEAQDAPQLVTLAHALKSASYSIGAKYIGEVCATLETEARQGQTLHGLALCAQLHDLYAALLPEMASLMP